jgi:gliding motility-associated-like protein
MRFLLPIFIILSLVLKLEATHIVGGVMSYECLGFNTTNNTITIRITLRVYRDAINGQAPFDNPANVGVYAGTSLAVFQTLQMTNPVITNAPIDLSNPCLSVTPGSVAVEEAVYRITVTLPYNPNGYTFSYQRCCRNHTINNLVNPGAVGATYTINLSGPAQLACNSSPVFNNYPPIVICRDQPINFDHSATDANGNTLVYSLCDPFTGGTQNNPAPNPPSPPPYIPVPFVAGFNASFPMPSNPVISINPNTGLLTGTPRQTGQYVVGVCVREFSPTGVLLSTTMRDFQFNVVNCFSTLQAQIRADSVDASGQGFIINSCNNNIITFINQSTAQPQSLITAYEWRFDLNNGNFATSNNTNPTIIFPGAGTYSGWLVVNPGQAGCTDTAYITLNVYPPALPQFEVIIDSCNISLPPIQFNDISITDPTAPTVQWLWNFGDGTFSNLQNPTHLYPNAGSYTVNLTMTDTNNCVHTYTLPVDWYPPAVPQFTVDDPDGCEPHTATFTHTSFPFGPGYSTLWSFGDGNISTLSPTVTHIYPNPGVYTVSLQHVSPWGCISNLDRNNLISVFEGPNAAYTYTYDSCVYEAVDFIDISTPNSLATPIVSWLWDFEDGTTSALQNPSHLYQFAGTYPVNLTVTDANGCTNTVFDSIYWYPKPVIAVNITAPQGCMPFEVFFDNQSYPINGYSTVWDFGDGNGSLQASPTHTYTNHGIYFVNLVITSPLGCTDSFLDTIEVFELPNANFSFSFDPCVIGPVSFDENSTTNTAGTALSNWEWNFGDATILNAQDTSHQYGLAGDFVVSLVVTDLNGCRDTATQIVPWHPAPIVAVIVSDSIGCQPLTVTFTNNSYPINGYTTTWNFGDGGTSLDASPTYTYQQPGSFIVHLYILSPTGCTGDFYNSIVVHQNPTADFAYDYDSCSYSGVHIYDLSSENLAGDSLVQWNWDYDIGTAVLGYSLADTLIAYTPRQNYTVILDIEDINGCRDTQSMVIPYFPAPVFPVLSHNTEACIPVSIDFNNNTLNDFPGYSFVWNFGNGQISTAFDTTYIYPNEGIFYPALTVLTASGCTETFRDTIIANGIPRAVFDASYDPCQLSDVRFRNLSIPSAQGNLTGTQWTFGDGTGSSDPLAFHSYNWPDTGSYSITLSIVDENGCTDDTTGSIYWRPQPVFPIGLQNSRGCVPHLVPAANPNPYPGNGYSTVWSFGDGRVSTEASPDIIYETAGVYDLQVIVSSPIGCVDTFNSRHTALEVPEAGFTYSPQGTELNIFNAQVQFSDASQRAGLWLWNFGDGNTVLLRNPMHTYRDTGQQLVTQIVFHQNGCTDTAQAILDIIPRFSYFLPNAFTPNNDGKNDFYMGAGHFQYIQDFSMSIFNRWGELIYENRSPYESWNGRKYNTGEYCQAGVYVVVVRFKGPRGEQEEIKGFATIVY